MKIGGANTEYMPHSVQEETLACLTPLIKAPVRFLCVIIVNRKSLTGADATI